MKLEIDKVVTLVNKWRQIVTLSTHWSIGIVLNENKDEVDEEDREDFAYAIITDNTFEADIYFNAFNYSNKDEVFLDLVCCHEILHIVLCQVENLVAFALKKNKKLATQINENMIEVLSRALLEAQAQNDRQIDVFLQ